MNGGVARLLSSSKFWAGVAAGITGLAAQTVPFLALWLGADNPKVQAVQHAADALSALAGALAGIFMHATGAEDAAHKIGLTPPANGNLTPAK